MRTCIAAGAGRTGLFVAVFLALGAVRGFGASGQADQTEPDLSEPSAIEQALIEQACASVRGNLADARPYDDCARAQLLALRTAFGRDLSKLTRPERRTIDARCKSGDVAQARDAYLACLGERLNALRLARGFPAVPAPAVTAADVALAAPAVASPAAGSRLGQVGVIAVGALVVAGALAAVRLRTRQRTCKTCGTPTKDPSRLCETCSRKAAQAALWAVAEREERERANADEQREARDRKDRLATEVFDPYAALAVARTASKEEIRAAYKEAMTKYHPDKVAHLGEELQDVAREKALALNRAYRLLN